MTIEEYSTHLGWMLKLGLHEQAIILGQEARTKIKSVQYGSSCYVQIISYWEPIASDAYTTQHVYKGGYKKRG